MAKRRYILSAKRGTIAKEIEYLLISLKLLYHKLSNIGKPIDKKLVVFEAYGGLSYACSPKAIYEAMKNDSRFDQYRFVWVFQDIDTYVDMVDERTQIVRYQSREYCSVFATAGTWIVNSMLSLDIAKRSGQIMVQCWHGTPLKRLRSDVVENTQNALDSYEDILRKNRLDTARYDYFITPSQFASERFTSAFQLNEIGNQNIVLETGYPRNDRLKLFQDPEAQKIKKRLNIPGDKKVILYAPTWRDDQFSDEKGFVYKPPLDIEALKKQLSDEYVLLYRAHYLVAGSIDFNSHKGFVYDVSAVDDINDLYFISDVLVTDYSSVFFDYANLGRPIVFFMHDKDHYKNDVRGLYLGFEELPGEIVTTQAQLVTVLQDIEDYGKKYKSALTTFSKRFNYLDDGHAAERVIEKVFPKT